LSQFTRNPRKRSLKRSTHLDTLNRHNSVNMCPEENLKQLLRRNLTFLRRLVYLTPSWYTGKCNFHFAACKGSVFLGPILPLCRVISHEGDALRTI
jgi:hypothetical protein